MLVFPFAHCECAGASADSENSRAGSILEFSKVHRYKEPSSLNPPASEIPEGYRVMVMNVKINGKSVPKAFYVKSVPEIKDNITKKASATIAGPKEYSINIEFTENGSKLFEKLTKEILDEDHATNTKQALAVIINGILVSTPYIQSVISKSAMIILPNSMPRKHQK